MGDSEEKFCLRWNNFGSNIGSAFKDLKNEEHLFDVSIVCNDNKIVKAHKLILSACSPFFRLIFKSHPHQHPLLYLKGVNHDDIAAILEFMYQGEVNVNQKDLPSFLAVAGELQVKGLTEKDSHNAKL